MLLIFRERNVQKHEKNLVLIFWQMNSLLTIPNTTKSKISTLNQLKTRVKQKT